MGQDSQQASARRSNLLACQPTAGLEREKTAGDDDSLVVVLRIPEVRPRFGDEALIGIRRLILFLGLEAGATLPSTHDHHRDMFIGRVHSKQNSEISIWKDLDHGQLIAPHLDAASLHGHFQRIGSVVVPPEREGGELFQEGVLPSRKQQSSLGHERFQGGDAGSFLSL